MKICRFCGIKTTLKKVEISVTHNCFVCHACVKIIKSLMVDNISIGYLRDLRYIRNEVDKLKLKINRLEGLHGRV